MGSTHLAEQGWQVGPLSALLHLLLLLLSGRERGSWGRRGQVDLAQGERDLS